MKTVLHVLSSDRYSGAENVVCQIMKLFEQEPDYKMIYCSPGGEIEQTLKEKKLMYVPLKKMSVHEIKRVAEQYKPDIIHAHDFRASILCSRLANNYRIISQLHVNGADMNRMSMKTVLYRMVSSKFEKIICVSESIQREFYYREVLKDSILLRNQIDAQSLLNQCDNDKNTYQYDICFLGRLTYAKNPERLLRVLRDCVKKEPKIKAAIIGDGDLKEQIEQLVEQMQLKKNVDVLGYRRNPYKILQSSRVLLMTSRYEGLPMVALEAMALGVPIVSTPVDGMNGLVVNGVTGYLTDDNSQLVEDVVKIVKEDRTYEDLSARTVQRFYQMNDMNVYKNTLNTVYVGG